MFNSLEYITEDNQTIRCERTDGTFKILDQATPEMMARAESGEWGAIEPYASDEPASDAETLEAERNQMEVATAQLAIALIDDGSITVVEAAIVASPRAKVVWEKSPRVRRAGPLLDAMLTVQSDIEIDALFRAAKLIEI